MLLQTNTKATQPHLFPPPSPQTPIPSLRQRTTTRYPHRPRLHPHQSNLPMLIRKPTHLLPKPSPRLKRHHPLLSQSLASTTLPNTAHHTSHMTKPPVLFRDNLVHPPQTQRPNRSDPIQPNQTPLLADVQRAAVVCDPAPVAGVVDMVLDAADVRVSVQVEGPVEGVGGGGGGKDVGRDVEAVGL